MYRVEVADAALVAPIRRVRLAYAMHRPARQGGDNSVRPFPPSVVWHACEP
jgi:hypothetical protein